MPLSLEPAPALAIDQIYARLLALGTGPNAADSARNMAALCLILINHINDADVIEAALALVEGLTPAQAA